jgi:protein subunit release factor A
MKDKERFELLAKGLQKETWPKIVTTGGQSTGRMESGVRIWHEDMGFDIRVSASRSQIKNIQFCVTIFELYCDEFYP